jgi:nitrogen-specific signal transduction histidine kinase
MTSENNNAHKSSMVSIFEWMPMCALVIDTNGLIQEVNQKAIHFFRATTKEDFIFDKQNIVNMIVDSHRGAELIKMIRKSSDFANNELLIRRFDKSIVGVDLYACLFPDASNQILILFDEKKPVSQVYMYELSQAFRRESQRLKPYLNKPGKKILEELIIADMVEEIVSDKVLKKNKGMIVSEDRMNQLAILLPDFSKKELTLCGYLSLKMSMDEIASLTGKTPNCLRVSFHRMLHKTNFTNGKEFLRILEALK